MTDKGVAVPGQPEGAGRAPTVVSKTVSVLKVLAAAGRDGITTSGVGRATGVSRPTAHRLLSALMNEGFADREGGTGRWRAGPELYLAGSAAAAMYDITDRVQDLLEDLADRTGESAYLSTLQGRETVCLAEVEGSFPLRSHVLRTGIRFPLGVASAGLVILAHLPRPEADTYIASVDLTKQWGRSHSRKALRERVAATRTAGYAVNPGLLVEGSWGVAAAVFDHANVPRWALSLTGVQTRFIDKRVPKLGHALLRSAHLLSRRL